MKKILITSLLGLTFSMTAIAAGSVYEKYTFIREMPKTLVQKYCVYQHDTYIENELVSTRNIMVTVPRAQKCPTKP